jgi:hypothetical protein
MGRWKIEVEASGSGAAPGRYRLLRPDAPSSPLQLDEQEARDLTDALIEMLRPQGYAAANGTGTEPRRVTVTRAKNRLRIRTQSATVKLPANEASALLEALAGTVGRATGRAKPRETPSLPRATGNPRPGSWQCSRCMITASGAPPDPPPAAGCHEGSPHEWVRSSVIRLVETVQQSLPGHTVSIVTDANAPTPEGTSCRVDDAAGQLVGVAVMTDECAMSAPLDRIEARANEVARLLKILRSAGDAARYVEVNERGVRIRLR